MDNSLNDGNIVVFFQQSMLTINPSISTNYKIKLPRKHFQSFVLMLMFCWLVT